MKNEKIKQIDTIITGFTEYLKQRYRLHPSSTYGYIAELRPFFTFLTDIDISDIKEITSSVIDKYRDTLLSLKITDGTRASRIRAVTRLFDYLLETNRLLLNPADKIEKIKQKRAAKEILSSREIAGLLARPDKSTKEGFRDYCILQILITTGIRRGELLALNIYDLDLIKGRIYVKHLLNKRVRALPLSDELTAALTRYLKEIRPIKSRCRPKERALFLGYKGDRLKCEGLGMRLNRYRRMAKIKKKITCDTIRHTVAIRLLKEKNIEDVSKLLGHKNVKTTYMNYILYKNG